MNDRFRVTGLLASRLEELQVPLPAVLQHAGLAPGFFRQEKIFVSTSELFALWQAILAISADPGIGLKLGAEARMERYDPASIAALHSRSFRDALQRMARYKQLTCPEKIRTVIENGECVVEFQWLLAENAEPTVLVDVCLSWIYSIGRRGTGTACTPLRVELRRPSQHVELLEGHYGTRIKFNAPQNAIVFRATDLDRPFVTHNAELLAMLSPQLEAELNAQPGSQGIGDQVAFHLKRLLAGHRPTIQDVARQMGLSPRTLQRRLTGSGTTFQQLLENARRDLARHYLRHSSLELNETAYLLGYEDANSFFRAFQNWEGTTPGRWRNNYRLETMERPVTV